MVLPGSTSVLRKEPWARSLLAWVLFLAQPHLCNSLTSHFSSYLWNRNHITTLTTSHNSCEAWADFKDWGTVSRKELIWSNFFPNSGNEFGSAFQNIPGRCLPPSAPKWRFQRAQRNSSFCWAAQILLPQVSSDLPSPEQQHLVHKWPHRYMKAVICLCLVCSSPGQLSWIPQLFLMLQIL